MNERKAEEEDEMLVWVWESILRRYFTFPPLNSCWMLSSFNSPPKHCVLFIESGIAIISHLLFFSPFFYCVVFIAPSSKCCESFQQCTQQCWCWTLYFLIDFCYQTTHVRLCTYFNVGIWKFLDDFVEAYERVDWIEWTNSVVRGF
jgi:hypothetical protein